MDWGETTSFIRKKPPETLFHMPSLPNITWPGPIQKVLNTKQVKQTSALVKKNYILFKRNRASTGCMLFSPLLFLILMTILDATSLSQDTNLAPKPFSINEIPLCKAWNDQNCYSVIYGPNTDSTVNQLFSSLAKNQSLDYTLNCNIKNPPKKENGVCGYSTEKDIREHVLQHPNTSIIGVYINYNPPKMLPSIYYNGTSSDNYLIEFMYALDRASFSIQSGTPNSFVLDLQQYPKPPPPTANSEVFNNWGSYFLILPPLFSFIFVMQQIVFEKEYELRKGLKIIGGKDSSYWFSTFITWSLFMLLSSLILVLMGMILQMHFFLRTNFFVLLFLFWFTSMAAVSMGLTWSVFLKTTRTATNFGFFILLISVVIAVFTTPQTITLWYLDLDFFKTCRDLFMFYPPFQFAKGFVDINRKTADTRNENGQTVPGPGFDWSDLYKIPKNQIGDYPAPAEAFNILLFQILFYYVVAWYLDAIYDNTSGGRRWPWFFLDPSYWGFKKGIPIEIPESVPGHFALGVHPKVIEAHKKATDMTNNVAIRVIDLGKTYKFWPWEKGNQALGGVSFTVDHGTCFALCGHNGSGKTTFINTILGLWNPSQGYGRIHGNCIVNQSDQIGDQVSALPQFEILWPLLTAREHLEIAFDLKGIQDTGSERQNKINDLLERVGLFSVADNVTQSFSGGMKRRIGIAMALIGSPKLILLDEPTSGLSPVDARKIWELIIQLKKDAVILLTSHSMYEVDVLADQVAILSHGKLRAIGSPLYLKHEFGSGYRISLITSPNYVDRLKAWVSQTMPQATLDSVSGGTCLYKIPTELTTQIPQFFSKIEALIHDESNDLIKQFGLSHTTLEDVFIATTKDGHIEAGGLT